MKTSAYASLLFSLPVAVASGATYSAIFGSLNTAIPDGNPTGVVLTGSLPSVPSREVVSDIAVGLTTAGGFNGDLYSQLTAPNGTLAVLLNQPGVTVSDPFGFQGSGLDVTLRDGAATSIQTTAETPGVVFAGEYRPSGTLGNMGGSAAQGQWTLFLADLAPGGQATLQSWSLNVTTTTANPSVYWTGAESTAWNPGATNWKLTDNHNATQFLTSDEVYFNDSPTRSVVDISGGDVSPLATHFSNTTATSYSLQGSNGIATGLVTKSGSGAVTMNTTNSYTGTTTVNGGSLIVNGSIATSLLTTANSGGTLGGTGTIGAVKITSDGTLAPTAQPSGSHQTISGNLNFETGSIFQWDLSAGPTDPGAGLSNQGSYGQVAASSITGPAADSVVFKIVLGGNAFTDAFWDTDKQWSDIFTVGGSAYSLESLFAATNFSGDVAANGMVTDQGQFSFSGSTLQWTAVPEPTNALVSLLICAGLLRRHRPNFGLATRSMPP